MDTIRLAIKDMDCSGCAAGIQMITENISGVSSASIDIDGKRGTWEVDLSKVSPSEIIEEIEKLGYSVKQI